jgi:putative SOS response-associated peptidase YedK
MCGRLNVSDDPFVKGLLKELGVESSQNLISAPFIGAAQPVSIVRQHDNKRELLSATWWLLLEYSAQSQQLFDNRGSCFKPNSKYATFNTRYDKLNTPRSVGYVPFRQTRCIIPASGFGETMKGNYHDLLAQKTAIAFGGLYKEYVHAETGESAYGCSIITLPAHPRLEHIYKKASPMMLKPDEFDLWLDPNQQSIEIFNDWLVPRLHQDFLVQPIDKPSLRNPIGDPHIVKADTVFR